ncbi:hypothetical protein ILUMI_21457 [Ignelater luminosus]|uniref:Craniofacial development protein 2-like n=1 Tax=Ignelater luminosus TaxID=2038154 RepID=A0A8K0G3K4_IGNLU|nr:hypothetical protein ILUMI_21457 [Ignelater luminosus]
MGKNIKSYGYDRIITANIKLERGDATIIAVYAPEEGKTDESSEFYEQLQRIINKINVTDQIILIGDFNARVGNTSIKDVIGTFATRTGKPTETSAHLTNQR